MRIDPLDFSQARMAPESVVRGLEMLDPTACILHLGGPQWLVGKVRPSSAARGEAEAMFANWTRNVSEGRRMTERGKLRVRFAQLALLGVRPVHQYALIGPPDDRIVHDFARSRFLWLHSADNALEKAGDAADDARVTAARNEVASVDRAKDAWKYAFTTSHMPSASLTPEIKPKAGWTRHDLSKAS